jgi:hypothetical protein
MLFSLNARAAEEGRSFMSGAERGATKLGQKIFGDNVTIRSDVGNTVLAADADRPRRPRRAADHVDRKRRREEPVLRPLLGAEATEAVHADQPAAKPGDGRRHRHRRADGESRHGAGCWSPSSGTSARWIR